MLIDKEQIRRRFERAAATYDRQAVIQERVAAKLLALLVVHGPAAPRRVLEIGCCTGLLTRQVLERCDTITDMVVNDLVEGFRTRVLERCGHLGATLGFLAGDIEEIPIPGRFDLVISSSTFHWFHDLAGVLARLHRHLEQDGCLAFAMYGPDNLREIRELTGIGLEYPDLDSLRALVERHFTVLACEERLETLVFADPMAVLQHLRQTGVNVPAGASWSRGRLARFERDYGAMFADGAGVRLSYHPMFVVARPRYAVGCRRLP